MGEICRYCGEEFMSSYFVNMHQAEDCPQQNDREVDTETNRNREEAGGGHDGR